MRTGNPFEAQARKFRDVQTKFYWIFLWAWCSRSQCSENRWKALFKRWPLGEERLWNFVLRDANQVLIWRETNPNGQFTIVYYRNYERRKKQLLFTWIGHLWGQPEREVPANCPESACNAKLGGMETNVTHKHWHSYLPQDVCWPTVLYIWYHHLESTCVR